MKKTPAHLLLLGFFFQLFCLMGCKSNININNYINKNVPLNLTISKRDDKTGLTTVKKIVVEADSDKYKELIEWGIANTDGWASKPASYLGNISISQGDFLMLYSLGGDVVIIQFSERKDKLKQYSKKVSSGELDFLKE